MPSQQEEKNTRHEKNRGLGVEQATSLSACPNPTAAAGEGPALIIAMITSAAFHTGVAVVSAVVMCHYLPPLPAIPSAETSAVDTPPGKVIIQKSVQQKF